MQSFEQNLKVTPGNFISNNCQEYINKDSQLATSTFSRIKTLLWNPPSFDALSDKTRT